MAKKGKLYHRICNYKQNIYLCGVNNNNLKMEYTAITKEMSNGWYFAQCEQLPAAMTQGKTIEEALENLKDAILLLLEDEKCVFR